MTDPLTDEELRTVLGHHDKARGRDYCLLCGQEWPCPKGRLIDVYRAQGTQLSEALGLLGDLDRFLDLSDEWDEWHLDYDRADAEDWWEVLRKCRIFLAPVDAGRKGAK